MPTSPARPPSGTTGPLDGGGKGSAPPALAREGAARVLSSAVTARTPASVPDSSLVASAGPAPGWGRRRSHLRPASASAAATATSADLIISTRPYLVVTRSLSGCTSTRAEITPVTTTTASSHPAALAYRPTRPRTAAGSARQATAARTT